MYGATKRGIDIVGSILGITLFALPMALIAGVIRLRMGTPVLFESERPGLGGRPFAMHKFRTMSIEMTAPDGRPLDDSERITPLGHWLRSTSLDELPELFDVLRGEMSLVGPRPLLMRYLDRYTEDQARRNDLKPGITGWSQVNGRNAISWEEKLALDIWYVDNRSLLLDSRILLLTLWRVLSRQGISADGHSTMPEFFGSSFQDSDDGTRRPEEG